MGKPAPLARHTPEEAQRRHERVLLQPVRRIRRATARRRMRGVGVQVGWAGGHGLCEAWRLHSRVLVATQAGLPHCRLHLRANNDGAARCRCCAHGGACVGGWVRNDDRAVAGQASA